jgi:hypothetical protein
MDFLLIFTSIIFLNWANLKEENHLKQKGVCNVTVNQMELQNLRHLIGGHATAEKKLRFYASQCQDAQIKQMFDQAAQSAMDTRNKLMSFLK